MRRTEPQIDLFGGEPAGERVEVEPHLFVILGATGDLNRRKLLPALFHLMREGHVGPESRIVGAARSTDKDDAAFRDWARGALREAGIPGEDLNVWCDRCLHYVGLGEDPETGYRRLGERIGELERDGDLPGNRVFYLALPPSAFAPVTRTLGAVGLDRSPGWTRLVVEKPFGRDLESARELNRTLHDHFGEEQVYRIDHYLGKETVQNLLVFRFANVVFESLWNRQHIDSVQITVAEDIGIADRAGYYDRAGALRDMVQNHVTQILSLVAMEVPVAYDAGAVRSEKIKALRSLQRIDPRRDAVLGRYEGGFVGGNRVPAYRREEGVADDSDTETYVALRLAFDSWRWKGVPFVLRTGKRLRRRVTEVAVTFHRPPVALFESLHCEPQVEPNVLLITLQPDEGFALFFDVKTPGEPLALRNQPLRFSYEEAFGPLPDAYETLLLDVLTGDQTLFVHADEVEASWQLYAPLLDGDLPVHGYAAGSWGPDEADRLLPDGGAGWRTR